MARHPGTFAVLALLATIAGAPAALAQKPGGILQLSLIHI